MNRNKRTQAREQKAIERAQDVIDRLWLKQTESRLDNILVETAEIYIGYIANDIAAEFRQAEKLLLVPGHLSDAIKMSAARIFIKHNNLLNKRLQKIYGLPKETPG
ncbi:MAG: hypothetical protein JNK00_00255 [Flavipsychrobacter sp.]|nr:hypothetical protein [Flavipsychrobacter sp.]